MSHAYDDLIFLHIRRFLSMVTCTSIWQKKFIISVSTVVFMYRFNENREHFTETLYTYAWNLFSYIEKFNFLLCKLFRFFGFVIFICFKKRQIEISLSK